VHQREPDRREQEARRGVQHGVPEADLEEVGLDFAEHFGQEHEHEDDDFEHAWYLDVHAVLDEPRQHVQHQHVDADYGVVVAPYPDAAYQDEYDDGAQYDIGPERAGLFLHFLGQHGAVLLFA